MAQLFAALPVVKYFQVLLVLVSFAALLVVKYPSATGASVFYVPYVLFSKYWCLLYSGRVYVLVDSA